MSQIVSTAYLMGGLGNQMFQISHAISQGWKNNIPSKFRPWSHTPMQANQPTKYLDNIFRNIEFSNEISDTVRVESGWPFTRINPLWISSIEFFGYYQSHKNFLGYDDSIKELFQPTEEFIKKIDLLYPEINKDDTIALHIRKGDYANISSVLPMIDKTYIDEALRQKSGYSNVFIFSDSIEWVRQNFNYRNQIIVTGLEDYEELWLMSLCKNNIMSNSTFSWWGGFLNQNQDKKIYVPSVWFGPDGEPNWEDVYIKSWIKIDTKYSNGYIVYEKN
jgi:hypothetical protein